MAASEGNLGIDPAEGASTPRILRLDPSWQQACLALDQRALNGLWTAEQWHRELDDPRRLCMGLVHPNTTLLAVACGWMVADELHITAVAVDPDRRRCGHGGLLLQALLQRARQQGAVHATLEVASDNVAALALYARTGFRTAGTRPGYYSDGRDAFIQWCRIPSPPSSTSVG
ncbi:alanine acetyltransferase [Synechococcus sp. KORDI-52]|uniref:GNAT family N-acetyltransferase n=1 Tax=Synechococcus sp. KORDI-52 TaxID=585425 RepID=UPI0004E07E5A|nr:GNAT family N-acetyltransferase [Synechococcus sp. KORDI-52]AII49098.1 alanine acetyltransferase [Synechococcus sp. KORDI-52]